VSASIRFPGGAGQKCRQGESGGGKKKKKREGTVEKEKKQGSPRERQAFCKTTEKKPVTAPTKLSRGLHINTTVGEWGDSSGERQTQMGTTTKGRDERQSIVKTKAHERGRSKLKSEGVA